jgi:uncharacterized protein (TIGR03086 family)
MDTTTATPATTHLPDLGPACREVAGLLNGITDDQLAGPTPCPRYAVRDILAHLVGLTLAFRDAARKDLGPTTDTSPDTGLPVLESDWREVLPRRLGDLADAWSDPGAWQGHTRVGGVDLPGSVTGLVALDEVLIHGWDLARSTGQAYDPDEAALRALYDFLAPGTQEEGGPLSADALFGPPVEVAADAPPLDRVIGLAGRHPEWKPGR